MLEALDSVRPCVREWKALARQKESHGWTFWPPRRRAAALVARSLHGRVTMLQMSLHGLPLRNCMFSANITRAVVGCKHHGTA